jgi:hypothetical protein
LIQNKIKVSNTQPWGSKAITYGLKRVPKSKFVLLSRGPYKQEMIQGEEGGSEKIQAEILCLLVMKHSRSIPGRHERAKPPLEPIGGTWERKKKPRLLRIAET